MLQLMSYLEYRLLLVKAAFQRFSQNKPIKSLHFGIVFVTFSEKQEVYVEYKRSKEKPMFIEARNGSI